MNVAHIKENYVKTNRQEDFWVLCTDESLNGDQLREPGLAPGQGWVISDGE